MCVNTADIHKIKGTNSEKIIGSICITLHNKAV